MNYRIVGKEAFKVVGIKDRFSLGDNLGMNVGNMWASTPQETIQKIIVLSNVEPIGLVGAYSGMYDDNTTDYYIGAITTADCPSDLVVLDVPAQTWAVFDIIGALPIAMAEIWGRIYSEWFPVTGYEHSKAPEIEWYSAGDMNSETYKSEIWIPVLKNNKYKY